MSMFGAFVFAWSTCHKVLDGCGGAQVCQTPLEILGHPYPKVAFRFLLVFTELAQRLFVECEFQRRYDIRVSLERRPKM